MKYRKKPVIIEAYRTNEEKVIHTLEGDMKAFAGDYVITGVKGEQYPVKGGGQFHTGQHAGDHG